MLEQAAIYQINLDRRVDRWEQCLANHAAMGFADLGVQRVPAVLEKGFGALGCTKSHVKCFSRFLTEDTRDYCMVLEDDFDFNITAGELDRQLRQVAEWGIDWDVLLLASSKINAFGTPHRELGRVFESLTTAGYIVRRRYVPKLMNCFVESLMSLERYREHTPRELIITRFACDVLWQRLQHIDNWFILLPVVGGQRASYSEVEDRFVDYSNEPV
ncbi:glycosyltransferase family 25 protein [Azospirillum sp.]|uniref:glycosyltransferase family 25 protein n=1 Tax=Azospirillum sp. TaxID=34012 RepID=UPI002D2E0D12|nr:glycosyltransferase family 25 protein [Azospirillum sp.]HYF89083.1 glycosyltransferase family 25 protein [Azospirillum sp.]